VKVDEVRPAAAEAFADVFGLSFDELPLETVAQIRAA
jgi:hypothetical protein